VAIAYDAGARELVIELPPVDLPANASHEIEQPQPGEAVMPVGGWLQGYRVEVLDAKGNAVPREVIHHVNIMAPERRELFSPIMQRIGGVGHETAPVVIPGVLGYPIEEGGRILISAMLHNPTPHPYQGVRIRVRFRHESRGLIDPFDVFPFYMDVTPPAELHSFDLPPGRSETSWEGSPAVPGRILGVGGHAHQYAVALKLLDVTEDRILYETAPITDDDGTVIGMAQDFFLTRLGIPVHPDHTYRLSVVYENPTGEVIPDGGMGALAESLPRVAARAGQRSIQPTPNTSRIMRSGRRRTGRRCVAHRARQPRAMVTAGTYTGRSENSRAKQDVPALVTAIGETVGEVEGAEQRIERDESAAADAQIAE
jgi:hypothetical protein